MDLKELITTKTVEELVNSSVTRLTDQGFRIKNFRPGRVFYTLLELAMQALAGLYELLLSVLPQIYLHSATGGWLDLKAADRGVYRKPAQKTIGNVVFSRTNTAGNIVIPAGAEVATQPDIKGVELRYLVQSETVLADGQASVTVAVEAETEGDIYNVGAGLINKMITYIAGIDSVSNAADWIIQEGADVEDDESLRQRALAKLEQMAGGSNDAAYISWAKEITGVADVRIDSQQPRGEGTVDIIIIGTAGIPTQALIDEVQAHINTKKSAIADVLVLAPTAVPVDITATVYVHPEYGDLAQIEAEENSVLDIMFKYGDTEYPEIKKVTELGLTRAQIISNLMSVDNVVNVSLTAPAADLTPTSRELLTKGIVNLTVQRMV